MVYAHRLQVQVVLYSTDYKGIAGGESGIRKLEGSIQPASCRFFVAGSAVLAICAVAPCTLLHAATFRQAGVIDHRSMLRPFGSGISHLIQHQLHHNAPILHDGRHRRPDGCANE
jgi:hypothetical protein